MGGGSLKRNSSTTAAIEVFSPAPSSAALISKKIKNNNKDMMSNIELSKTVIKSIDGAELDNNSKPGKTLSVDYNGLNSDISGSEYADDPKYADDGAGDYLDDGDVDDDASEYDDENAEYLYDDDDGDEYLEMQAQFDDVDLPPGVEASVPWLMDTSSAENLKVDGENTNIASSSRVLNPKKNNQQFMDDVLRKLMYFKQFDTVEDYSDHYYQGHGSGKGMQPSKSWAKKIQEEWKILEDNLPETIYVRAYESRMDLMRAAIIGPDGTPYHDGLFFFDIFFPTTYPCSPPSVHYHSGGLRLNPNLYNCGKVCLSLLGTWSGKSTELWVPDKSTMLQVLVSIQALILNTDPFFNEPGHETSYKGAEGMKRSKKYSEEVCILSMKTMTYSLKNPPKNFEDLVAGHFRIRAPDIMAACEVYREGAGVGSDFRKIVKEGEKIANNNSAEFKSSLAQVVTILSEAFIKNGTKEISSEVNKEPSQP